MKMGVCGRRCRARRAQDISRLLGECQLRRHVDMRHFKLQTSNFKLQSCYQTRPPNAKQTRVCSHCMAVRSAGHWANKGAHARNSSARFVTAYARAWVIITWGNRDSLLGAVTVRSATCASQQREQPVIVCGGAGRSCALASRWHADAGAVARPRRQR